MKHTAEEVTCPIITEQQPGNYHFQTVCEDCDVSFRLVRASLGEVEDLYHQGRITQDEFEGYGLAWDLVSPYRDAARVRISEFPAVRRIARKLLRAKGLDVPAALNDLVEVAAGCPRINLAGEKCRRGVPHADWCCDFPPRPKESASVAHDARVCATDCKAKS